MKQVSISITTLDSLKETRPTFLAIGVFDGVHLGHQQMLQNMVAAARQAGASSAVLTFFPHPGAVINQKQGRIYICTLQERLLLLTELGLDLVITHSFDDQVRQTPAGEFVNQLSRNLSLRQLWGGAFSLGFNREGDLPFLKNMGKHNNFSVHQVETMVQWEGKPVSSSRVRQALRSGEIDEINGCLGRTYRLVGTVIHGDGRGGPMGIPTANLKIWEELILPANGVYAAYAWLDDQKYRAAINVGYRPTVNGHTLNVEAHLLDFEGDIYGQELSLEFVRRIRDEHKFSNLDALVNQIKADIETVRRHLPA